MKQLRTKALLLALPFILAFAIFYIIPYGSVFYYSFATQTKPVQFAGFENFAPVLTNEYYRMALINTGVFTAISIPARKRTTAEKQFYLITITAGELPRSSQLLASG